MDENHEGRGGRSLGAGRIPLKADAQREIVVVLRGMQARMGKDAARRDPNYRTLLRLLKAHERPIPGTNFTFAQLHALKLQIMIYNHFKAGKPLPPYLIESLRSWATVGRQSQPVEKKTPTLPSSAHNPSSSSENALSEPESALKDPPAPEDRRLPVRRPEGLPHKPQPLPIDFIMEERNRIVQRRIDLERKDIEEILNDPGCTGRQKAFCESRIRQMSLLSLQQAVRSQVYAEKLAADREGRPGSKNRDKAFRTLQREAERIERYRQRVRETEERERRKAQLGWLGGLVEHHGKFKQFHRDVARKSIRLAAKAVLKYHEEVHRNAERAIREAEKQRIQKLKDDDEEGYLELVRQTKNKRLMELLDQTDSYLKQLGATIKEERKKERREEALYDDDDDEDIGETGPDGKKRTYYDLAHRVKEEVTEQPRILVGGTLKEYQMQGLQWMLSLYNNRLNGILADEMGLGKTVQTIALICHLVEKKQNAGPFMILVPLSTMSNWELEFERWAPKIRCITFKGDRSKRKKIFDEILNKGLFNVCLSTFEYVVRGKNFLRRIEWQYVIVDEGHRMKNSESRLSSVLGDQFKSRNRLLLTGTPLQNSLAELWALLNFLLPSVFSSVDTFESWFAAPLSKVSGSSDHAALTEEENLLIIRRLHQTLRPFMLRRLKADVLKSGEKLPAKQEDIILCDMSAWQKYMYKRLVNNEKLVFTDSHGKRRYNTLSNPAMQLKKVVNHPYLFFRDYAQEVPDGPELWRSSGKFDMLDACVQKFIRSGHRILIFNQMTRVVDLQAQLLEYRGIRYFRLDGSTTAEVRKQYVEEFNDENAKVHVFLLTTRAGGLGVNLQTADTVIIFDSDWNPQADLQAQDRAHRIGQKREVRILRFITANSVEQTILDKATFKRGLEDKVIKAGMFDDTSKDSERQDMLRQLLREEANTSDDEEELPTEEEVNRTIARTDEEFELFTQIDEERKGQRNGMTPLMMEDELPQWILTPSDEEDEGEDSARTKRRAASKKARYSVDGLTDNQYLILLEKEAQGVSFEEAENAVRRRRKRRRITNDVETDDSSDEGEERDDEDEGEQEENDNDSDFGNRKTRGKPRAVSAKYPGSLEPTPPPSGKRPRGRPRKYPNKHEETPRSQIMDRHRSSASVPEVSSRLPRGRLGKSPSLTNGKESVEDEEDGEIVMTEDENTSQDDEPNEKTRNDHLRESDSGDVEDGELTDDVGNETSEAEDGDDPEDGELPERCDMEMSPSPAPSPLDERDEVGDNDLEDPTLEEGELPDAMDDVDDMETALRDLDGSDGEISERDDNPLLFGGSMLDQINGVRETGGFSRDLSDGEVSDGELDA